jgi:hypothetical protein
MPCLRAIRRDFLRSAPEREKGGNRIFPRHGRKKNTFGIHIMTLKKVKQEKGCTGMVYVFAPSEQ